MSTLYNTQRGAQYDPVDAELWTWDGQRLGKLGEFEEMRFTFNEREADTAELELPLNDLTATLLPCDGLVLIGMRINGVSHVSVPVRAEATSRDGQPMLSVTAAGGWALLDGEVVSPSLSSDVTISAKEEFELSGALEYVVKEAVRVGSISAGHPVVILPNLGRGPYVQFTGAWESPAEVIKQVIAHTNYRVRVQGWLPGDPQPTPDLNLTKPCVVIDVVPYRDLGLRWSEAAGDVSEWRVTRKRPSTTRLVVGNDVQNGEFLAASRFKRVVGVETESPWNRREAYLKADTKAATREGFLDVIVEEYLMDAAASVELSRSGAHVEIEATVDASSVWEFGTDDKRPLQYDVGDLAVIDLPVIGEVEQIVTAVEVKITPSEFAVIPKVGTPDTLDTSIYGTAADTARRVARIERRS